MATILDQRATGDGYDVRILTGGEAYTLHFAAQPSEAEIAETILRFEMNYIDRIADNLLLEQEEGSNVQLFDQ